MTMNHNTAHLEIRPNALSAIGDLNCAQDDLVRLCALLDNAFGELLPSFRTVQLAARCEGAAPEIDQLSGCAIVALQCEDLASQLIGHTRKRLAAARESLKFLHPVPQIAQTSVVWAAGFATVGEFSSMAPVQQDAMAAGTIELFGSAGTNMVARSGQESDALMPILKRGLLPVPHSVCR